MEPKHNKQSRQLMFEFFIGCFFLLACLILFYFTVVVKGKDLFFNGKEYILKVRFPSVGTLTVNDKVCVIGMNMGKVKSLVPSENFDSVVAELSLTKRVSVYRDYSISIRNSSVFGGEFVYINPGTAKADILPQELVFTGKPPVDLIYEASDLIRLLKKDAEELRKVVEEERLFENVSKAAKGFNEGAKKFDEFLDKLKSSKGSLGKLINDPGAYDQAKEMFENVISSSRKLNDTLDEIKSGKGTFSKLLTNDEAYKKLMKSLEDWSIITSRIASSKGSFGKLLNDNGKLYDALFESITISKDLVAQLKQGDGTLGKLMTDKQLYDEMLETAKQIRAIVESYKEQAPMATFGSMALGAF